MSKWAFQVLKMMEPRKHSGLPPNRVHWAGAGRMMDVSEAAQVPRAMRWDAFGFSRLLVIRPESTPSRR